MDETKVANLDLLVVDNIRTLTLARHTEHPVAIILVGPPFSGKTTLVSNLARKFPLTVLSQEAISEFLAPRATFFKRREEEIFLLAAKTIEALVKQKISSIFDASIKKREDREFIRKLVGEAGGRMLLVELLLPDEYAFSKISSMNKQIQHGKRKGFMLGSELLEYEKNTIEKALPLENPVSYNMLEPLTREKVESTLQAMLG